MTNHLRTSRPRFAVGRSTMKRGLVSAVAMASCAVVALPGAAQAGPAPVAPDARTATVVKTAASTQEPANVPVSGTATTAAASSWYNTVRYNRLYKYGGPIGISRCASPRYALNTLAGIQAYHANFLSCLNTAWSGNLKKAGLPFRIPRLYYYQSSYNTACGPISGLAYYCSANGGQIWIPWTVYRTWNAQNSLWTRTFVAQTIAHEYGHHVQYLSGILGASWNRQRYTFSTSADKLEESRRRELQATCFGGGYLGADRRYFPMGGAFYDQWKWTIYHMGDSAGRPRDHGSYQNNGFWAFRGFTYHTSGSCITWAVSDTMVS
ncbi:MAG: neutral zinc metallopeptidase [Kribbellaceae bacterium]